MKYYVFNLTCHVLFVSVFCFILISVASCANLERFPPVSLSQSGLLVLFSYWFLCGWQCIQRIYHRL